MILDEYIEYISKVRRYSKRTCELYSEILGRFFSFAGTTGDKEMLEALTPSVIRSYEVHLMDAGGLDPRTVNLHLSVLSGFCRYLMKDGRLKSNPARMVSRPKVEKRLPVFYREDSMKEYFDSTDCYASEENLS